jgi:hypothetical protein
MNYQPARSSRGRFSQGSICVPQIWVQVTCVQLACLFVAGRDTGPVVFIAGKMSWQHACSWTRSVLPWIADVGMLSDYHRLAYASWDDGTRTRLPVGGGGSSTVSEPFTRQVAHSIVIHWKGGDRENTMKI